MDLWVGEYRRILLGCSNRRTPAGDLDLAAANFQQLKQLVAHSVLADGAESAGLAPFFKFGVHKGRECFHVQNYVGVLRLGGVQVEILPKVSRTMDHPAPARRTLVTMLKALRDPPFKQASHAALHAERMPLAEVVYRELVDQAAAVARRGLARTYVEREANLHLVRGKLQVAGHIRRNAVMQQRAWCAFGELRPNRPANRLLRTALDVVRRHSRELDTQRLAREVLVHFDGVPTTHQVTVDFAAVRRDRSIAHYAGALATARLVLLELNPLTQAGTEDAIAMLFPMERVFEDYVAVCLRKQFPEWQLRTQVTGTHLVERHGARPRFSLRPDFEWRNGRRRVVMDTKWKLLDQALPDKNYGMTQSDMYQMFAYGEKFLADQEQRISVLIYPSTAKFNRALDSFWFAQDRSVLAVVPFDCERGELVTSPAEQGMFTSWLD